MSTQTKACETCVSRLICLSRGEACIGHNDEELFSHLLSVVLPDYDVYRMLARIKKLQSEGSK